MTDHQQNEEEKLNSLTQEQIDQCIAILESLNEDTNQIWEMPEDKKRALMKAAGQLTRPSRDEFQRRRKDAKKAAKRKQTEKDKHARKETGIRSAREASIFVAPTMIDLTGAKADKDLKLTSHVTVTSVKLCLIHFITSTIRCVRNVEISTMLKDFKQQV